MTNTIRQQLKNNTTNFLVQSTFCISAKIDHIITANALERIPNQYCKFIWRKTNLILRTKFSLRKKKLILRKTFILRNSKKKKKEERLILWKQKSFYENKTSFYDNNTHSTKSKLILRKQLVLRKQKSFYQNTHFTKTKLILSTIQSRIQSRTKSRSKQTPCKKLNHWAETQTMEPTNKWLSPSLPLGDKIMSAVWFKVSNFCCDHEWFNKDILMIYLPYRCLAWADSYRWALAFSLSGHALLTFSLVQVASNAGTPALANTEWTVD